MSNALTFFRLQQVAARVVGLVIAVALAGCRGAEGPAGPTGPTGPAGGSASLITAMGTGSLVANDTVFRYTLVPGLSANVIVAAGSTGATLIETDGGVQLNSSDANAACVVDIALFVDATQVGAERRVSVVNNATVSYSVATYGFSTHATLTPVAHTVSVMAKWFPTTVQECYVSSSAGGSGLPGNPRLQGALNIVVFP